MIKIDDLYEYLPKGKWKGVDGISLETFANAFRESAQNAGIPVAFKMDQVKSGNFLKPIVEDCLVIYHPEHEKDYYKYVVRISRQGIYSFISVDRTGTSKQQFKAVAKDAYKEDRKGKAMSYKMGSMLGQAVATIGQNKAKLEQEEEYYDCIDDIFEEVLQ